ncbi:FAD-dependent oxidoreductase [Rhizobium sp. TH2]|uniref:FAD-dependent oxidoreductase n=1 Tax=Rhizobium sp. TH2 TaxID=2775403 RepID=UPI002157F05F|nr:FAD-dependent oxidoreductase [Rhizobium sp. TH2]UVC08388.1 FAD-dependent oxidoreductase [Rhizobium sp. TH2]
MANLPGRAESCWVANAPATHYPALDGRQKTDTVIVGAGIVGLTAALKLCELGRPVVVLEGLRVGGQVTGRSTAKITTQHALIYRHLIEKRGLRAAQDYADANRAGAWLIGTWASHYGIACDLESKDAYAYADRAERRHDVEAEAQAARMVGLDAEVLNHAPLPFHTGPTLRFRAQAQFNPARYLVGLAAAVTVCGGRIFEASRAGEFEEAERWRVLTDGGSVDAENVVVATNMTVKSPVGMARRTQPRCHTVMAFRINDPALIDGMFIGIDDPTHSLRLGRDRDGPLLIVLGPKFNTGQDGDVARRFVDLERWTKARFPVGEAAWHWCNEDYDTPDKVPYAGAADPEKAPGFYIATGFNGWGISNGTAVGMMIADRIADRPSHWTDLYDPARPYPEDFHMDGDSQSVVESVEKIPPGGGGVIIRGEEKIAAWRSEAGRLHTVSASCTHKGCTVTWNNADRTWDCPCHGSVFAADGSVIHGPARKALPPVRLELEG